MPRADNITTYMCQMSENSGSHPPGAQGTVQVSIGISLTLSVQHLKRQMKVQGGSNMTGTNLYVNKCKQSRSYLNHLVYS